MSGSTAQATTYQIAPTTTTPIMNFKEMPRVTAKVAFTVLSAMNMIIRPPSETTPPMPASVTAGTPKMRRPPPPSQICGRRYGKTTPARLTRMNAAIWASRAPSRLAFGIWTSATNAAVPVTAQSRMALTGVWCLSLTSPSWRGTVRSSDQASM